MIYLIAIILSLVACAQSFLSEATTGNITHLKYGRPPKAGVALFPLIIFGPLLFLGAAWVLRRFVPEHAIGILVGGFLTLSWFWWYSFVTLREELRRLRAVRHSYEHAAPDSPPPRTESASSSSPMSAGTEGSNIYRLGRDLRDIPAHDPAREAVVAQALEILRKEYVEKGQEKLYEELLSNGLMSILTNRVSYPEVAARLGMPKPAVMFAAYRFRHRLMDLLRKLGGEDPGDDEGSGSASIPIPKRPLTPKDSAGAAARIPDEEEDAA